MGQLAAVLGASSLPLLPSGTRPCRSCLPCEVSHIAVAAFCKEALSQLTKNCAPVFQQRRACNVEVATTLVTHKDMVDYNGQNRTVPISVKQARLLQAPQQRR